MIFELVQVIAARISWSGSAIARAIIAVVLVTAVTLALLGLGTFGLATLVTDRSDNLPALMSKMAISSARRASICHPGSRITCRRISTSWRRRRRSGFAAMRGRCR